VKAPLTLDDIVGALNPQFERVNTHLTEVDTRLATVDAINTRIRAIEDGAPKMRTDLDEAVRAIADLAKQMERAQRLRDQAGAGWEEGREFRLDANGRVVPQLSRECLEWFRDAIAVEAPGYRDFVKGTLQRDVAPLSFFTGARDTSQLNSGAGTVGGYVVPPEYRPELLKLLIAYGQARKLFRQIPMPTDKLTMPALDAEMNVYEIAENAAPTESFPTVALFTLNATIWGALTHIPLKLIMQSNPAIVQIVVEAIFRAFAKNEDVQGFTRSDGTPYYGLLYTPTSGNTNSRGNANKVILGGASNSTKTHYSDFTFSDAQAAIDATPTPAQDGAVFLMHRTQLSNLQSQAQSKAASWYNPLVQQPNGSWTLYGYPIVTVEAMPANSTSANANKPFVAFCNPASAMAQGDMQQPTVAQDSSIGFKNGQIWVRGLEIFGFEAMVKDAITVIYTSTT
jgi:HK97 family phage major capsid protein